MISEMRDLWPRVSPREADLVEKLLADGVVHQKGSSLQRDFEAAFAAAVEEPFCVSFSCGTSAMEGALAAVGVRPDSVVVMPSYAYPAGVVAARALGARPEFVDCGRDSLQVDLDQVRAAAKRGAAAIIVQHCWGGVCDLTALRAIAREHAIPIISDCSHSFGATWDGQTAPLHGDVGVYSLGPGKWVSGGELGVIVCREPEIHDRCIMYSGMNRPRSDLVAPAAWTQFETCYSVKSRPHVYALALATGSLERADEKIARGTEVANGMVRALQRVSWLTLEPQPIAARRVYWRLVVEVSTSWSALLVESALRREGVTLFPNEYAPPLHKRQVHRWRSYADLLAHRLVESDGNHEEVALPRAELLATNTVTLNVPIQPNGDYAKAFEKVLCKLDANQDQLRNIAVTPAVGGAP